MIRQVVVSICVIAGLAGCNSNNSDSSNTSALPDYLTKSKLGGETTVLTTGAGSFSIPAPNISLLGEADFKVGNDFFEKPWTIAPGSADLRDGLGPLFNVSSCQSCHINDGRGHAPTGADDINANSLLVRLFRPAKDENEVAQLLNENVGNLVDAHYGGQIQDRANPGVPAEATVKVTYSDKIVTFNDGYKVVLRKPTFELTNLGYGELETNTRLSPRVANQMIGLGLLEMISETDIVANADPDDQDNDGISGEANYVWDVTAEKSVLGRFGWKAGQPSLRQQNAGAFNGDIGLTSSLFPEESCTEIQTDCANQISGASIDEGVEAGQFIIDMVEIYTQHLAVPQRRNVTDTKVLAGGKLFHEAGCPACHIPEYKTQSSENLPALSNQIIFPFTDMLLHDMGEDLADTTQAGEPAPENETVEFNASSREWRTAPLWGVGLTQTVDANATFLHDGRARTLLEAVLWHGGEAESAKQAVLAFDASERASFEAFLNSL